MNSLLFKASVASMYAEDGVLTVAFADSTSSDPENYLILQQESPRVEGNREDDYYFEINDRSMSGEGGFQRAYLDGGDLIIAFAEDLKKKYSCSFLKIVGVESVCDVEELRKALHAVFDNTGCIFDD
jgi:hypothetical protein